MRMDLAVKDKQNNTIGYIINASNIEDGILKAKEVFKKYSTIAWATEGFNIPECFKCCAMDATTLNQLILMNPKL